MKLFKRLRNKTAREEERQSNFSDLNPNSLERDPYSAQDNQLDEDYYEWIQDDMAEGQEKYQDFGRQESISSRQDWPDEVHQWDDADLDQAKWNSEGQTIQESEAYDAYNETNQELWPEGSAGPSRLDKYDSQQMEHRAKYSAKIDRFLNNGIIIVGILLLAVLLIAFLV
ncbi:hypothetical protein M0R79_06615 [Ignavigranum ruoffiae]|uniref:hypothetical protein n=1 Tax=Ignavigranum ruoffiae TaxID=89093 RepID=UPI00205E1AFC|nr:hypothetical protein [Ignavigranum ruoffiae]UPQ85322.1 hypothetical protein M0R79_06615 [Ignavigranum ruoffiae]